jgi:hypothetical protein
VNITVAHHPSGQPVTVEISNLSQALRDFTDIGRRISTLDAQIPAKLTVLAAAGINQYATKPTEDERVAAMLGFYTNRGGEEDAVAKKARVAIAAVGSALKGITEDLSRIHTQMNRFNRGIQQRRISNLRSFTIKINDRARLVGALHAIVEASASVDAKDSWELFSFREGDNRYFNDNVEQAKDYLLQHAARGMTLSLSDLFSVEFEVEEHNGTVRTFSEIEKAGSNGTRSTVKVLSSILFIRHLINPQVHDSYQLPIFFDEGASLDEGNQRSLVVTAGEYGFVPMFASVDPLTTCHYAINVTRPASGCTVITEDDWRIIEPIHEPAEQDATTA